MKIPTTATVKLLRDLAERKRRLGIHPCCGRVIDGPHSGECPDHHDVRSYYQ